MTIDKTIKMLIAKEQCMERETSGIDTNCNNHNCDNCDLCYEQGNMGEQKEMLKYAVEIMRKHQKIQEIVSDFREYQKGISCGFGGATYMQMVSEVVEDGKKVVIDGDKTKNVRGNRAKELLDHISALFTKDDVITMFTELQKEIEELRLDRPLMSRGYECYGHEDKTPTEIRQECSDIIQQKIEQLKEENENAK